MKVPTIEINPREIRIDKGVIAKLMGVDANDIPEPYRGMIQRELDETDNYTNIKGGYIISENVNILSPKGVFEFENTLFKAGANVVSNLRQSEKLAFFICTAGEEVTLRSRQHMKSGNMLEGYIADIAGTLLVEGAMDIIYGRLKEEIGQAGLEMTNRYSPGYCDWNVSEQNKLFSFFPGGFCGVTLSESSLMIPLKSISGVIGIGRDVKFNQFVCSDCKDGNCIYRNIIYR
jgi:hypothetical protein